MKRGIQKTAALVPVKPLFFVMRDKVWAFCLKLSDSQNEKEDKVSIFVDGFSFTRSQACFMINTKRGIKTAALVTTKPLLLSISQFSESVFLNLVTFCPIRTQL